MSERASGLTRKNIQIDEDESQSDTDDESVESETPGGDYLLWHQLQRRVP